MLRKVVLDLGNWNFALFFLYYVILIYGGLNGWFERIEYYIQKRKKYLFGEHTWLIFSNFFIWVFPALLFGLALGPSL